MEQKLRIEGVYDKRTLKHLKLNGVKDFCFDFSPKSFNFIQEYVFLDEIVNLLDTTDRIFFHFTRSNDPMVLKLTLELKKQGLNFNNIFFEFDEWSVESGPDKFDFNYLLNFSNIKDPSKLIFQNFKGFIFQFNFFENLHRSQLLNNFANNFFTKYQQYLNDDSLMLLKIEWQNNLINSLFDLFEFNLLSFPINSNIEVCYRNVDLKKLSEEMHILKSSTLL